MFRAGSRSITFAATECASILIICKWSLIKKIKGDVTSPLQKRRFEMTEELTPAPKPCSSCPYRLDAPSGIWHPEEYAKLSRYDGEMAEQAMKKAFQVFMCHQHNGCICSGWLATHGADNLLALRISGKNVSLGTFYYETDVPVFPSGAAAAHHGIKDIAEPKEEAERAMRGIAKLKKGRANAPKPSAKSAGESP
jgi:hypothetical protein